MTDEEGRGPFVPLPLARPTGTPDAPEVRRLPPVELVYVRYRDPQPLEFPGTIGMLPGPVCHAGGIRLREDEEFLALGEVAFAPENEAYVRRFGVDLFPSYRHILTIPKASILERRSFPIAPAPRVGSS